MHAPTFNQIAQKFLALSKYDVHIYFEGGSPKARNIADLLACALARVIPHAMGPFQGETAGSCCSFDVVIPAECLSKVLDFLEMNNNGLSICVQPSGSEKDNKDLALWVGQPVPLNSETLATAAVQQKRISSPAPPQI